MAKTTKKQTVVEFVIKVIINNIIYLQLKDVAKALGFKTQKAFELAYPNLVHKERGHGKLVKQEDYNKLLLENEQAFNKQLFVEQTQVIDKRRKIEDKISMIPLMKMFHGDALAYNLGYRTEDDKPDFNRYIKERYIPEEIAKSYVQDKHYDAYDREVQSLLYRTGMIESYNHYDYPKDLLNYEEYGYEIYVSTLIDKKGEPELLAYLTGNGICIKLDSCDYEFKLDQTSINEKGQVVLPVYNYDKDKYFYYVGETDRDFSQYNMIENYLWLISENQEVENSPQDNYDAFRFYDKGLDLPISTDLLTALVSNNSGYYLYDGILNTSISSYVDAEVIE